MLLKDVRFLITQNPDRDIREHVDIRISDGTITEIGKNLTKDDELVDCSNKVVLPGLINAHTHAAMTLLRGLSDNKVLQNWLHEDVLPAEERLTEEDIYYGTLLAITEMVKTGTTCFNDMYAPEAPVAKAVDETGMRAVLARGLVDADGEGETKLRESKELLETYQSHKRITPVVAPHAIYTCSREFLQQARDQAEQYDTLLHTHLSETKKENEDCEQEHGMTPTEYLHDIGFLTERTVAAHGVWLTEHDMRLLQKTGAGIAHNPCANLKLGSGIADVPRLQAHDVTVGLGTDGVSSNNNLNMFEEAKFASLLQKRNDPRHMTEQEALDMATIKSAELLGLADKVGSIEEGKRADIICIDLDDETLSPIHGKRGLLSNLIYASDGRVTDTIVEGQALVRNGTPQTLDTGNVMGECQKRANRISGEER